MEIVKRVLLVLGAITALVLIIKYVLPILFKVLGFLAYVIAWIIIIVLIIVLIWYLVQKFRP